MASKQSVQLKAMTLEVVAPPQKRPQELFLQVGGKRYQVKDWAQASAMICRARDVSGMGASEMGDTFPIFTATGLQVAYVSYNGRVWNGDRYLPDAKPLYPVDGGYVQ